MRKGVDITHKPARTQTQTNKHKHVHGVLGPVVAMPLDAADGTDGTKKACAAEAIRARTPRTLQEEDDEGDACLEARRPPPLLLDTMVC